MRSVRAIQRDLWRVLVRTLFALFLVPGIVWVFSHHVLAERDAAFAAAVEAKISASARPAAEQAAEQAFYRINTPSSTCSPASAAPADMREALCETWSGEWQFYWAREIAWYSLFFGALLLLMVAGLGLVAFRSRAAQYGSLVLGWRVLSLASAAEVVVQSTMAVFLSFWVTAYYTERYFIKLVAIVGILAVVAAFAAVAQIFARNKNDMHLEGELVPEADAPELWKRVRTLADELGTAPPDQIVAGIDANFFVTEAPMMVSGAALSGRTLYVSVPLLRVLDKPEAEAVLVHELAHLKGGDTSSSAALGPKLYQFDAYCHAMGDNILTIVAFYLLSLYRFIFELALMRESRAREFLADRAAASAIGGMALIRALIKVAAYSTYRVRVEQELFERQEKQEQTIGIASFVANGLQSFARSDDFQNAMATSSMPHPFDSHPGLEERMSNVDTVVRADDFGAVVDSEQADGWASRIDTAAAIEARLWTIYEARFAEAHEHDLAYRYRPEGDAERAIVEKYFPPVRFDLKDELHMLVTFDGVTLPKDGSFIAWSDVTNLEYEDGYLGDLLKISATQKGQVGSDTTKVKLAGIKSQRDQLKSVLAHYWHRDKVSRGKA